MNCKRIQDLLITDYVDARMPDKLKTLVDQHLTACPACEDFLSSIKKEIISPLHNSVQSVPDELLWSRIKNAIQEEQGLELERKLAPGFWERFRVVLNLPRPAFALATIVTMIFVIGSSQLFMPAPMVKIDGPAQAAYISSLMDTSSADATSTSSDTQTPIEQYFL